MVAARGPFFLEIFAGEAGLTQQLRALGVPTLPPIEIEVKGNVLQAADIEDPELLAFVTQLIRVGAVRLVHFGTPCGSFSNARKIPGPGPRPLRSKARPMGLGQLTTNEQAQLDDGNRLLALSLDLIEALLTAGSDFVLENPANSLMWRVPRLRLLVKRWRLQWVVCDQCQFGSEHMKPTAFLVSHAALHEVGLRCSGGHGHVPLRGRHRVQGEWVFRTRQAQVYPPQLCAALARCIHHIMCGRTPQFAESFKLVHQDDVRKRPLGEEAKFRQHRQEAAAKLAQAAGYQMKRGAIRPLLTHEVEPGIAVEWALQVSHPFSVPPPLTETMLRNINLVALQGHAVPRARSHDLDWWRREAHRLLPVTASWVEQVPDRHLRCLLRGAPEGHPCELGRTCHVALYDQFLRFVRSADQDLVKCLLHGFPIVGRILPSHRWPAYEKSQKVIPVQEAMDRAWEIRKKVILRADSVPVSDDLRSLWASSMEDVAEGSAAEPFSSIEEVSQFVGADNWIPTQRFAVVQKNKVRGCDSATVNLINRITEIVEKLQLPSTDLNVAALRELRTRCGGKKLRGWVLDERKAYRQVPIAPGHRKFSVICLKDPSSGVTKFFVMIGHSFGLVSAVYNYNRRSAAINEILEKIFGLVSFNFYDDKYGFEAEETIDSAHEVAITVHWLLGAQFDAKKLQKTAAPVILGVTYNLEQMILEIKKERKQELIELIDSYLIAGVLDAGSAGKLKGKLMFGASQLWGKVGRAFFRPLSERQYSRDQGGDRSLLTPQIVRALKHWKRLISAGPPRPIDLRTERKADVVVFTDGFAPDFRKGEVDPERIGIVVFDRRSPAPFQVSEPIPENVIKKWVPRKSQIFPVELIAPVLALYTFRDLLRGRDVVFLIDSEGVEAALVKGYSAREDVASIVEVFWNLALELGVNAFIDRISTDANPADWPSRSRLEIGRNAGWLLAECQWPPELL